MAICGEFATTICLDFKPARLAYRSVELSRLRPLRATPPNRAAVAEPYQGAIPFKSWRMIGREGRRRATVLNPRRLNVEAVPVNTLDVLPCIAVSTGYASSAGALARLAAFNASVIRAAMTPRLRYPRRI